MTTATMNCVAADATATVAELLQGIGSGDRAAWDELLRRYGKLVSTTVRSFRLQDADAFDAIQTTWMRLAENAARVQFPERLGGWLATTARRECLGILRRTRLGPQYTDVALDMVSDQSPGPEKQAIDAHTARTLRILVDELSPRQRVLIRMLFADDPCSYHTVARSTGIPLGAIGPTRTRALQRLRDKIGQHDLGSAA